MLDPYKCLFNRFDFVTSIGHVKKKVTFTTFLTTIGKDSPSDVDDYFLIYVSQADGQDLPPSVVYPTD